MEQVIKLAFVLVAVLVVGVILAIGYSLLGGTSLPPDTEQEITGAAGTVSNFLSALCSECRKARYSDNVCFIVDASILSGAINENSIIFADANPKFAKGQHFIKVENQNGDCLLYEI